MTRHLAKRRLIARTFRDNIDTIEDAIVPAKNGKLVTSIEDVQDPKVQAAWDALPPGCRIAIVNFWQECS